MKKIIVATKNPAKVRAVVNGFKKMFPEEEFEYIPVKAKSEVHDQPLTDIETYQGAYNRMRNSIGERPDGNLWIGIEGGIETHNTTVMAFAWVVISNSKKIGKARTGAFELPRAISDLMNMGLELGEADDIFFNRSDSKKTNGAIGILTNDVIDRTALYEQAVIMAAIPFRYPDLYPQLS